MSEIHTDPADDETIVNFQTSLSTETDEVAVTFEVGESGVASWLERSGRSQRSRRRAVDIEFLKVGLVADLPGASNSGFMAIHIPHRRGVKGVLQQELQDRFKKDFPKLVLRIDPVVPAGALEQAIQSQTINQVKLVAINHPGDRFEDSQRWIDSEDLGRIELVLHPKRLRRFAPELLRRFLQDPKVINEVVRFENMTFDQAKVRFTLPTGRQRTVNIERPGAGHAMTIDLDDGFGLQLDRDGDPTDTSLIAALQQALEELVTPEA